MAQSGLTHKLSAIATPIFTRWHARSFPRLAHRRSLQDRPMLPLSVPMWAAVTGIVVSVGVGLFFGIWPANKAARLDHVVALRYEGVGQPILPNAAYFFVSRTACATCG